MQFHHWSVIEIPRIRLELSLVCFRQSWTKPLRPIQPKLESWCRFTEQTSSPPLSQFNVVNRGEITFGILRLYNLNIEWGEWGVKSARLFYKEFMTRGMRICYQGKVAGLNELCSRL